MTIDPDKFSFSPQWSSDEIIVTHPDIPGAIRITGNDIQQGPDLHNHKAEAIRAWVNKCSNTKGDAIQRAIHQSSGRT